MKTRSNVVAEIKGPILDWLDGLCHAPGLYRYCRSAYRPYSAESSAQAVGVLSELGELETMDRQRIDQHIGALQSFQAEDGGFRDPLVTEDDRIDKNHPWLKINEHIAGSCEGTLAALGAEPLRPNQTEPIYHVDQLDPDPWIRGLDHRQVPWGRCHNVAFSLLWYRRKFGLTDRMDAKSERIYELIESEMLNPADGMPGAVDHPIGRRIAGYFMLTFCYLPYQRPLPNPRAAIDLILQAVTPDGQIGEGGMCQNWDAIYVLNQVCRQSGWAYRHQEVCGLVETVREFLLSTHRKQDGGFSFHPDVCQQEHNAVRVAPAASESDVQGTLMTLCCLNIADSLRAGRAHRTFTEPWLRRMGGRG